LTCGDNIADRIL